MATKMIYVEDLQPGMWLQAHKPAQAQQGYFLVQPQAPTFQNHLVTEVRKFGSVVSVLLLDPETGDESGLTLPEWEHVRTVLDPIPAEQFLAREEPS